MTTWQDLLEKFCLVCNLHYKFTKVPIRMNEGKYLVCRLTFKDIYRCNPTLCGRTNEAIASLRKYRRYGGDFLGITAEETAKLFFEAFLMPNVYLYAHDFEAWNAANALKEFSGNSLECLEIKLDLMTMDKVKSDLTTIEEKRDDVKDI